MVIKVTISVVIFVFHAMASKGPLAHAHLHPEWPEGHSFRDI